jgi:hypothetical protein
MIWLGVFPAVCPSDTSSFKSFPSTFLLSQDVISPLALTFAGPFDFAFSFLLFGYTIGKKW